MNDARTLEHAFALPELARRTFDRKVETHLRALVDSGVDPAKIKLHPTELVMVGEYKVVMTRRVEVLP